MVFSQSSRKTRSLLKVVDLNRLKPEKNQQVNNSTGVVTDGPSHTTPPSPMATTSFAEVYLKPEPLFDSTMVQDLEKFQDVDPSWYSTAAIYEQAPSKDYKKSEARGQTIHTIDTFDTYDTYDTFSPQGRDTAITNQFTDFNLTTPENSKIPDGEEYLQLGHIVSLNELTDFTNLPSIFAYSGSDDCRPDTPSWLDFDLKWPATDTNTNTDYANINNTSANTHQEDFLLRTQPPRLSLNVAEAAARARSGPNASVSTPDIVQHILEVEDYVQTQTPDQPWLVKDEEQDRQVSNCVLRTTVDMPSPPHALSCSSKSHMESDEETSRLRSKRRRRLDDDSDDSDYIPYGEKTPKKQKRRRPNVPIEDYQIVAPTRSTQELPKPRRGRPPKRRESNESAWSTDNTSPKEKYRDSRIKNNEASRRSRFNRKIREREMEEEAKRLEEVNRKLIREVDELDKLYNTRLRELVDKSGK